MSVFNGLDLIHSFRVLAEELSFRRAVERLNLDQSALSRRIRKLEHLVGCPLFERTTQHATLTPGDRHDLLQLSSVDPSAFGTIPLALGDMSEWESFRQRLRDIFGRYGIGLHVAYQSANVLAVVDLVRGGASPRAGSRAMT